VFSTYKALAEEKMVWLSFSQKFDLLVSKTVGKCEGLVAQICCFLVFVSFY